MPRSKETFDPLMFLCKQAAGDFNAVLSASGETSKAPGGAMKIEGPWDRSSRFKCHRITGTAPEKTVIQFYDQKELVHIVPEGKEFASEMVRGFVIRDMTRFKIFAVNSEKEKEPVFIRIEGDLYGASELLSY